MTQAYPLQWPEGRSRKPKGQRKPAPFRSKRNSRFLQPLTVTEATQRLIRELDMLGAGCEVLSTNLEVRLDGLPRSGQRDPDDCGACVYFDLGGDAVAMPCDTYDTVAGNIAAIAAHIEATRKIERHGVASVKEMFTGFAALPSPDQKKSWREVFGWSHDGIPPTARLHDRYRELSKRRHPDSPTGSTEKMQELSEAYEQAKVECA